MRPIVCWIPVAALSVLAACGDEQAGPTPGPAPAGQALAQPAATPAPPAPSAPGAKMPAAKRAFFEVMQLVQEKYVDAGIEPDVLWSGATEGLLRRLLQVRDPRVRINTLLDPQTVKEMKLGLGGRISGAGMVIKIVEGMVLARHVIAGGPADRAGIRDGDRLLAVDGKPLRGLELDAIVGLIRGETGSTVKLFVQREAREWDQPVVRGPVILPVVSHLALPGGAGYLRVSNFNRRTAAQLDAAIAALTGKGSRAIVLDLRGSPGGLLETAVAVADRFLPPGAEVVTLQRRGGVEEVHRASGAHPGDNLPVALLVDGATASGAEIVAAALRDNGRASIVGEPTMGKGTVETIIRLENGWALKLTVARFYTPRKESLQGAGIRPDLVIPAAAGAEIATYAEPPDVRRLAADPQVAAALHLLALERR